MKCVTVKDFYKPFHRLISKKVKCLDRTDKRIRRRADIYDKDYKKGITA